VQIKTLRVCNYRCIRDETLALDPLTALVGPNGSGKSSFLNAIGLFYEPSPRIGIEDFYADDPDSPIEIAVTFKGLSPSAQHLFQSYMQGDELTVVRVLSMAGGKVTARFHGSTRQYPEFARVRQAENATEKKRIYNEVRGRYTELPSWTNQDAAPVAMAEWEAAHPQELEWTRDDGQFFGFTEVGRGYLGRFTKLIFVPAVRDAGADAMDTKGSAITELMDLVVRTTINQRSDLRELREQTSQSYRTLMDPENLPELAALRTHLSDTLAGYAPGTAVAIGWDLASEIDLPMPRANVKLVEDGFERAVSRTGHGLQRSFIMTMLQHLALARRAALADQAEREDQEGNGIAYAYGPDLVLAIEEPELYQHPNRQRHLARVLLELASGNRAGVDGQTQVIYTTHSPLMVGIDRFDQVRRVRKEVCGPGLPKVARIVTTTLDRVASALHGALDVTAPPFTADTIRPRLQPLLTPWMSEGFFADVVVLVEGEDDRAAILGQAAALEASLETRGIAVIPCMGKCNLDRPFLVFTQFEIPVYLLWDSDKDGRDPHSETNRSLLRLVGEPVEDWPHYVHERSACFEQNLETTLRTELGEEIFDRLIEVEQARLGMHKRDQALKNPTAIRGMIDSARSECRESATLKAIVQAILDLASPGDVPPERAAPQRVSGPTRAAS
jgi:putative ATP-dependent endonuclease of OLD family